MVGESMEEERTATKEKKGLLSKVKASIAIQSKEKNKVSGGEAWVPVHTKIK